MATFEVGAWVYYGKNTCSKGTIVTLLPDTDEAEVEWASGGTYKRIHSLSKLTLVEESTGKTRRQTKRFEPSAIEEEKKKSPVRKKVCPKRRVTKPSVARRTASLTCKLPAKPRNKKKSVSSRGKEAKKKPVKVEDSPSPFDFDEEESHVSSRKPPARPRNKEKSVSSRGKEAKKKPVKVEDEFEPRSLVPLELKKGDHVWAKDGLDGKEEYEAIMVEDPSSTSEFVKIKWKSRKGTKDVAKSSCRLMFVLTAQNEGASRRRPTRKAASVAKTTYPSSNDEPKPPAKRARKVGPPSNVKTDWTSSDESEDYCPGRSTKIANVGTGVKAKETSVRAYAVEANKADCDDLSTVSLGSVMNIAESIHESSMNESDTESILTEATTQFPSPGQAHPKFPGCHVIKDTPEGWVIFTNKQEWKPATTESPDKHAGVVATCVAPEAVVDEGPGKPCAALPEVKMAFRLQQTLFVQKQTSRLQV